MPLPRLDITERNVLRDIDRLSNYWATCFVLDPPHQYFISEMILLRLFSLLNEALEEIASKLVAGASYKNGSFPALLFRANNVIGAKSAMLTHGRPRPRRWLNWTYILEVPNNVRYVIDQGDSFVVKCNSHSAIIEEMRKVRNFAAHRNTSTRLGYKQVIRNVYGANSKISPGRFLVSNRMVTTSKLVEYMGSTKIIVSDLVSG